MNPWHLDFLQTVFFDVKDTRIENIKKCFYVCYKSSYLPSWYIIPDFFINYIRWYNDFFRISFFWVFCIAQMFLILLLIMCGNVFNIFLFLYFYIFFWILFFLSFLYYVLDCFFVFFREYIRSVFKLWSYGHYGHCQICIILYFFVHYIMVIMAIWSWLKWRNGHFCWATWRSI